MKLELNSYSSFFYVTLTFLISRREESLPPEFLYLLGPTDVLKMIDMFGGQTVYIPTRKELSEDLLSALVAYYKYCEGKSELWIMEELNINKRELNSCYLKIRNYKNYINSEGLIAPELMKDLVDVKRKSTKRI